MERQYEYTAVPDPLIFDKRLTYLERLILMALVSHARGHQNVNVKQTTLSADFGIAEAQISQLIKSIEGKGFIKKKKEQRGFSYIFCFKIKKWD